MTNEITFHNRTDIQPMSADRRTENLKALLSSLSANKQAQITSTWKLYSGWYEMANVDVWQLNVVQAIDFFWVDVNFDENTIAIRGAKKRTADNVDYSKC